MDYGFASLAFEAALVALLMMLLNCPVNHLAGRALVAEKNAYARAAMWSIIPQWLLNVMHIHLASASFEFRYPEA
jgi:hypothetical protein